ncbi:MAG TPA: ATP-binding cassette domain-containing protein, partial [Spirochaetia bacterium]|nr:ATP-binding cassette domain-containing protein [Spirochaetia bacterium]
MRVELQDIHKSFGNVHANAGICLAIPSGTIQGILGENGAGKSTLMKILSGFIRPDSGLIALDGNPVTVRSPADAIHRGVGMLHQDPLDFPPLTLIDNFILGRTAGFFPDRRSAIREFRELTVRFEFHLEPDAHVDDLTVGERQQLEILRLMSLGARVLILDEPTTGISLPQKLKLFATLRKLAVDGVTIIFVSHKLEDVESLCSQAAVLRHGELAGTAAPPFDTDALVAMMFGKEISFGGRSATVAGDPVICLDRISLEDSRLEIRDVNFEARAGEVIGLAGMEGSGQALLLSACAGLFRTVAGRVTVGRHDMTGRSYHAFRRKGVVYLPAARLEQGLVPTLTLTDHFILSEGLSGLFIDRNRTTDLAWEKITTYNIKGTPETPAESLSGGNQQRLLLAMLRTPLSLILLEHPSRGLDIESTMYIW